MSNFNKDNIASFLVTDANVVNKAAEKLYAWYEGFRLSNNEGRVNFLKHMVAYGALPSYDEAKKILNKSNLTEKEYKDISNRCVSSLNSILQSHTYTNDEGVTTNLSFNNLSNIPLIKENKSLYDNGYNVNVENYYDISDLQGNSIDRTKATQGTIGYGNRDAYMHVVNSIADNVYGVGDDKDHIYFVEYYLQHGDLPKSVVDKRVNKTSVDWRYNDLLRIIKQETSKYLNDNKDKLPEDVLNSFKTYFYKDSEDVEYSALLQKGYGDYSNYTHVLGSDTATNAKSKALGKVLDYYMTYGEYPSEYQIRSLVDMDRGIPYKDLIECIDVYLKNAGIDSAYVEEHTLLNRLAKDKGYSVTIKDNGTFVYTSSDGKLVKPQSNEDGSYIFIDPDTGSEVASSQVISDERIILPSGAIAYLPVSEEYKANDYKFDNYGALGDVVTSKVVAYATNYYITTGGTEITEAELESAFPGLDINQTNLNDINADVKTFISKNGVTQEQLNAQQSAYIDYVSKYGKAPNVISIDDRNLMGYTDKHGIPIVNQGSTPDNTPGNTPGNQDNIPGNQSNQINQSNNSNSNIVTTEDKVVTPEYKEDAYNQYYRDVWSLEPGTTGYSIYNNLANAERNAAQSAMALADAQYQNAAMQQAATVKNIADQVRAERMAKLRAGMNEAQIANQDMQMMMSNINAMNDQMNAMNYNTLQAQQQYNLAQDTAYQEYLNQAQAMNQSGAAYYAAQAGDAAYYANWLKDNPGMTLYYDKATGQYKTTTTK